MRRDLFFEALPVDAAGNPVPCRAAAGPTIELRFGVAWSLRMQLPLTWTSDAFVGDSIGGRSVPTFGAITLANADGELDAWAGYAWAGREVAISHATDPDAIAATLLAGLRTEQPTWTPTTLTVSIRDHAALFDVPLQPNVYTGAGGYAGSSTLAGTKKPVLLGFAEAFEPVMLDATVTADVAGTGRVYQLHDGAIEVADLIIYERGVPFATLISVADVFAWNPVGQAGKVAVDYARGVIRLASPPVGVIVCTARATVPVTDAVHTSHANIARQAIAHAGVAVPIDDASLTAFNALNPTEWVGMHVTDGRTLGATLDAIATSCGALWSVDLDTGWFTLRQIAWTASSWTIPEDRIVTAPVRTPTDVPAWRLTFEVNRRHRVHSETDFGASAATPAIQTKFGQEYDHWIRTDDDTHTRHPLARDVVILSLYGDHAQSGFVTSFTEAVRQGALLARDRDRITVSVWGHARQCRLGDTITLTYPRYGFDAGKQFLVLGIDESFGLDTDADVTTLRLWGPKQAGE